MKQISANITGSFILNGIDLTTTVESSSIWSGSIASRVSNLEQFSSSLDATFATDAQLNAVTQSVNTLSSSFLSYTSSTDDKIAQLNRETASLNLATASLYAATASLYAATASINSYTSSNNASIADIRVATASLYAATASINSYTASNNNNVAALYAATASLYNATASIYGATSSLFSYTASNNANITSLNAATASLNQYTASLNLNSSSFATTGSNTFVGTQYFSNASNAISFTSTGSFYSDGGVRVTKDLYVSGTSYFNNVTVFGTQSVNYITSSQLNIATNIITVNTSTPTVRFGGLAVYDSGSLGTGLTGSILWDSEDNQWIYSNPSGSTYDSAVFLVGPRSFGALGNEPGITVNSLIKGDGAHHTTSSGVFEVSGSVGIGTSSPAYKLDVQGTGNFTGNINGTSTTFSSYMSAGSIVAADPGSAYYSWNNRIGSGLAVVGTLMNSGSLFVTGSALFNGSVSITGSLNITSNLITNNFSSSTLYIGQSGNTRFGFAANTATLNFNSGLPYVLGTFTGEPLVLGTNNTEYMRITSTGNVGIGTTSPASTYILDVRGGNILFNNANVNIVAKDNGTGYAIYVAQSQNGSGGIMDAGVQGATANAIMTGAPANAGVVGMRGSHELHFGTGATSRMMIDTSGNVGIGTTSPAYKLHVSGSIFGNSITFPGGGGAYNYITNSGQNLILNADDDIIFRNDNDIEKMRINFNGNVGIGTTSPTYKLEVNGSFKSGIISSISDSTEQIVIKTSSNTDKQLIIGRTADYAQIIAITQNVSYVPLALQPNGGNIGIGTTSPSQLLHLKTELAATSSAGSAIQIESGGAGGDQGWIGVNKGTGNGLEISVENRDIIFNTGATTPFGGTERMRIVSGGNVGIGTTSPTQLLHVLNSSADAERGIRISNVNTGVSADASLRIDGYAGSYIDFYRNAGFRWRFQRIAFSDDFKITADTGAGGVGDVMYFKYSNGYVGIGTTSPSRPLTIYTGAPTGATTANASTALLIDSNANQYIELRTASSSSGLMQGMLFTDNGQNAFIGFKEYTGGVAGTYGEAIHLAVYDYSNSDPNNGIYFGTSTTPSTGVSTSHMFIRANGNIGIGNTSPNYKLDVNGNIRATRLYIQDGGNATDPMIRNESYTSTGIFFPSANTFAISTNANERIRIVSGGNIGINTTSPGGRLEVRANDSYANGDQNNIRLTNAGYRNDELSSYNEGGYLDFYFENYNDAYGGTVYDRVLDIVAKGSPDGTYGKGVIRFKANPKTAGSNSTEIMRIQGDNKVVVTGNVNPSANGTYDLGTSSLRWSTVYTSDLSLSNGIGDYTIVEGENDLFLYNNKQNKVYKFVVEEVDPSTATPKKS